MQENDGQRLPRCGVLLPNDNRRRISSWVAWSMIILPIVLAIIYNFAGNINNGDITSDMQPAATPPEYMQDLLNVLKNLEDQTNRYIFTNQQATV
jgi:hypothetical protein